MLAHTTEPDARRSEAAQEESTHIEDPPFGGVRVTRRVKPERVEEFEEWVSGITAATARFPVYLGAEVLKPGDPSDTDYHIIFKFDHMSDLKRWEDSDERRDWCLRVEPLQEGPAYRHVVVGLQRWFVLPSIRDAFGDPLQRMPLGFRTLVGREALRLFLTPAPFRQSGE